MVIVADINLIFCCIVE